MCSCPESSKRAVIPERSLATPYRGSCSIVHKPQRNCAAASSASNYCETSEETTDTWTPL
eukprot:6455741-Amphidinium_carterae.2